MGDAELFWLIPVVVMVGAWILRGLLRSEEEPRPRQPAWPGEGPERSARPVTDVDRFLEEINRLRRKSAEERAEAPRPILAPPPVRRPTVRPVTREAPRPRPMTTIPVAIPAAEPAPRQPFPEVVIPVEVIPAVRPAPAASTGAAAAFVPTKMVARAPSPALAQLVASLRTRESVRSAFLLRELLDAPLCKRRQRRGESYS